MFNDTPQALTIQDVGYILTYRHVEHCRQKIHVTYMRLIHGAAIVEQRVSYNEWDTRNLIIHHRTLAVNSMGGGHCVPSNG